MTFQATPYMQFNGQASEALDFYHDVFGGTLDVMRYKDMPMEGMEGDPEWVMHGSLTLDNGVTFFAADSPGSHGHGNVAICVWGDDASQLEQFHSRLQEGGEVQIPFDASPWGAYFGQVIDSYGIVWMLEGGDSDK